jgi:hypothetical protein
MSLSPRPPQSQGASLPEDDKQSGQPHYAGGGTTAMPMDWKKADAIKIENQKGIPMRLAKILMRLAWRLARGKVGAGIVVNPNGKWQPIKL